jgi:hypothetical protein
LDGETRRSDEEAYEKGWTNDKENQIRFHSGRDDQRNGFRPE